MPASPLISMTLVLVVSSSCLGLDAGQYVFHHSKDDSSPTLHLPGHPANDWIALDLQGTAPVFPGEESEDEDDSSKEKVFHSSTNVHLAHHLDEAFTRQNAIFKETHREVLTPPPRS